MTEGTGADRRKRGAWYTPPELVDLVVARSLERWIGCDATSRPGVGVPSDRALRVLDPACGDGRFLVAAARALGARGAAVHLVGVEISAEAAAAARTELETHVPWADATILEGDALTYGRHGASFDLIVGNPPFLSPLSSDTPSRAASSGTYSDVAVDFLALSLDLIAPGGRIGLILPQSVLASRDAGEVRRRAERQCRRAWSWWSRDLQFDANVVVCALGFEAHDGHDGHDESVSAVEGIEPPRWTDVVTDVMGVPRLDARMLSVRGVLGDRATLGANFRDEYYGLVPAVIDDPSRSRYLTADETTETTGVVDGYPPLVTSGLIDPGWCRWGNRRARYGKVTYEAPRVDLRRLDPRMRAWAARKLVPKVLVANQTKIVEAVADPGGQWLPAVPLVSIIPTIAGAAGPGSADAVWEIAAVLTSPVATVWAWHELAGTGMSARVLRVGPRILAQLPWPAGRLDAAVDALRAGDVVACGRAVNRAYGLGDDLERGATAPPGVDVSSEVTSPETLTSWWIERLPGRGTEATSSRCVR